MTLLAPAPAISISALAASLQTAIAGQPPMTLGPATLGEQLPLNPLLQLLQVSTLEISAPTVSSTEASLTLSGKISVLNLQDLDLVLTVAVTDEGAQIALGVRLNDDFSLGTALQLPAINDFHLKNPCLVLANYDDPNFTFSQLGSFKGINRGLTLIGTLPLAGMGLSQTLGIDVQAVDVRMNIGPTPADLKLAAALNMSVALGRGFVLRDPMLQLELLPPIVGLTGSVDATLDASPLAFIGGFRVRAAPTPSAALSATLLGDWQDPLGAQGLSVSNLALDWAIPAGLPGIAGTVRFGGNMVSVAVRFDATDPLLQAHISPIDLGSVISDLAAASGGIPSSLARTLSDFSLENIELTIAPRNTTLGAISYSQGVTMSVGQLRCFGVSSSGMIHSSAENGFLLNANLNSFSLGDSVQIDECALELALKLLTPPQLRFTGSTSVLGIRSQVAVSHSDSGFQFEMQGAIFGQTAATLSVSGPYLPAGQDVSVIARLDTSWLNQLQAHAVAEITAWGSAAHAKLEAAQQLLAAKQRDNAAFAQKIESTRQAIIADRANAAAQLAQAQRNVVTAQTRVDSLNAQINDMLAVIATERSRAQSKLQDGQASLAAAQGEVNRLNGEISSTSSWFYGLPKADFPWRPSQAREGAWFGAKMGGLYAARDGAIGVLDAATSSANLLQQAVDTFPAAADPRVVVLGTARDAASGVLNGCNQALATAQAGITLIPIEADPRMIALLTERDCAAIGMVAAQAALSQLQSSLGPITSLVASAVAPKLAIRQASFAVKLSTLVESAVQLNVTLESGSKYVVICDLHHALLSAISLAKQVVGIDAPSALEMSDALLDAASHAEQLAQLTKLPHGKKVVMFCAANGKYVAIRGAGEPIGWVDSAMNPAGHFILSRSQDASGSWVSFQSADAPDLALSIAGDPTLRGQPLDGANPNNTSAWFKFERDSLYRKSDGQPLNFTTVTAGQRLSITPFSFGGAPYLFTYRTSGGGISSIAGELIGPEVSLPIDPGWKHIVAYELDGVPCLLFYRYDGFTLSYRVTPQGLDNQMSFGKWDDNWAQITSYSIGGVPYLLFYRPGGSVSYRVTATGIDSPRGRGAWDSDWQIIRGFMFEGTAYLLFYRRTEIWTYRITATNLDHGTLVGTNFDSDWTQITPYVSGGSVKLLFSKASGTTLTYDLTPSRLEKGTAVMWPPAGSQLFADASGKRAQLALDAAIVIEYVTLDPGQSATPQAAPPPPPPAPVQQSAADAAKVDISATAKVAQRSAAEQAAAAHGEEMKRAAESTMTGLVAAHQQAEAALRTQAALSRVRPAAQHQGSVKLDGTCWIEVPATRPSKVVLGDSVTVMVSSTLQLGPQGTFEAWIKRKELSPAVLLCKGNNGNNPEFILYLSTNVSFFTGQHWLAAGGTLKTDVWQHIAVTYDENHVVCHVDGVEVGRIEEHAPILAGVQPLRIGQRGIQPGYDNLHGLIDEVRVWNVMRTESELRGNMYRTLSGGTPGLLGCWRLDEGSGTLVADQSPAGNHGTLQGSPSWSSDGAPNTPAALGNGMKLGAERSVVISSAGLGCGIAMTFEARLLVQAFADDCAAILNNRSDGPADAFLFGLRSDGRLMLSWQTARGCTTVDSTELVPLGHSTHVAVVRGGATVTFYINGQVAGSAETADPQPLNVGHSALIIGAQKNGATRPLSATISEVRIFSIGRTADEIRSTQDRPLSGRETGLEAYFRLDEADGDTAFDQTAAGRHGRIIRTAPGDQGAS